MITTFAIGMPQWFNDMIDSIVGFISQYVDPAQLVGGIFILLVIGAIILVLLDG